ncbi:MAG: hypothetical protein ABJH04_02515 [Cyclobacteriaceae bacterium]
MKNYKIYSAITMLMLFIAMACSDEFPGKSPNMNDNVGAVTLVTVNPNKNFFNLTAPSLAAEEIEFTLDVDGFGITTVNNVEVELVFTEKDRLYDPFREEAVDSIYAPVTLEVVSSFPATVVITGQEVADALGIAIGDFEVGDAFQVTLPINTADGRRLTTALASDLCNEPAQPSFGGCGVAWAISCPSDLAGSYTSVVVSSNVDIPSNFTTPLPVTISGSAGIYVLSDGTGFLFGEPVGLAFTDVCETISVSLASTTYPTLVLYDQNVGTSIDPGTGVITMDITLNGGTCCGAAGIQYVLELTPN